MGCTIAIYVPVRDLAQRRIILIRRNYIYSVRNFHWFVVLILPPRICKPILGFNENDFAVNSIGIVEVYRLTRDSCLIVRSRNEENEERVFRYVYAHFYLDQAFLLFG